jgi:alpha-galactosidase
MKLQTLFLCLSVAMPATSTHAALVSQSELRDSASWCSASFHGTPMTLPLSWKMDETNSREVIGNWEGTRSEDTLDTYRARKVIRLSDPGTGLTVTCEVTIFSDYPAVEWVLHFANRGDRDSPILSEVWPADIIFPRVGDAAQVLHYADGSQAAPTDFHPRELPLSPGAEHQFSPDGGRSSDGFMPYFNLAQSDQDGVLFAIGWTGQWTATFSSDANGDVHVQAGMERTHLRLHPGEEIRTPSILMMHYDGDRLHGQNLWRQLMLRHYTPTPSGKPIELPVAASGATIGFNKVSEVNQIQAIEAVQARKLPVNTWWIDAGWSMGGFPAGMGTWEPDPARFPHGLGPVSEAAHRAGLQCLVWFEPERVMPGSWLRKNHPEWLLTPSDLPAPLAYQKKWRLLDLGNASARTWAVDTFSGYIDSADIDIYRQDFNMHPLYYWQTDEPDDRQGMREIHYIEALYAFLDTLLQRRPGLLIDNCASGGRRLDFEMMRRSVPLWRSDYCWDPLGAQCISYGLSFWLPIHGLGAVSTDPYDFRSGMGACATYAFDYYSGAAEFWPILAERIHEYERIQQYFLGDYYPLTPYDATEGSWVAWQYDRPDLGGGVLQAFRRPENPEKALTVKLFNLSNDARYEITDLDSGVVQAFTGAELIAQGLALTLPGQRSSAVYIYRLADSSASEGD